MNVRRSLDLHSIEDNTMLRLSVAAELLFPDGSITTNTLRSEARAGRLTTWRIANRDYTTKAAVEGMIEKCRNQSSHQLSSSELQDQERKRPTGSFMITERKSAQAAAKASARRLRSNSQNTSHELGGPVSVRGIHTKS